jgi:hypothetical protein
MPEPNNHSNVSAWQLTDSTESRLAAFEGHKKDLLTNLRDAYEGGPKSEPFDTDKSWHDLRDVAGAYFLVGNAKSIERESTRQTVARACTPFRQSSRIG